MANEDYMQQMSKKLESARDRLRQGQQVKTLKESSPALFEIIDGEISMIINRMTQPEALSYDNYLDNHGQVRGIMRIRDLINSKEAEAVQAKQEVQALETNIQQIRSDQKQQ